MCQVIGNIFIIYALKNSEIRDLFFTSETSEKICKSTFHYFSTIERNSYFISKFDIKILRLVFVRNLHKNELTHLFLNTYVSMHF